MMKSYFFCIQFPVVQMDAALITNGIVIKMMIVEISQMKKIAKIKLAMLNNSRAVVDIV